MRAEGRARSAPQEISGALHPLTHSDSQPLTRLTTTHSGVASAAGTPETPATTPVVVARILTTSPGPGHRALRSPCRSPVEAPSDEKPSVPAALPGSARTGVNEDDRWTSCPRRQRRPRPRGQERRQGRCVTLSGHAIGGGHMTSRDVDRFRACGHGLEVGRRCPPRRAECPRRHACHRCSSLTKCPARSLSRAVTVQSRACS